MTKTTLTEQDLSNFQYDGLSIQPLTNGKYLLILMLKDRSESERLMNILHENLFDLAVTINEETGIYKLIFQFTDSQLNMEFNTGKTEASYPNIKKLENNTLHSITTGFWINDPEQPGSFECNQNPKKIGTMSAQESFGLAEGVQFTASDSDNQPPVILLAFPDQERLLSSEAINALRKLAEMKECRPVLEIKIIDPEHLNLRLWDIFFELDIHINKLKYNPDEIKSFIEKTDKNDHFIFVLGLYTSHKKQITLVATKDTGPEFVMIYGYKYIA